MIGGYDPDLNITLSVRQDFILLLRLKADDDGTAPNIGDIFPAGTTIDLRFYPDMAAVRAGTEIDGTAIQPTITDDGVLIRIESPIADKSLPGQWCGCIDSRPAGTHWRTGHSRPQGRQG